MDTTTLFQLRRGNCFLLAGMIAMLAVLPAHCAEWE